MTTKVQIRDYPQLSYVLTVLADSYGKRQLSPDLQVIPEAFLARFAEGERQLASLTDMQMDLLVTGDQESDEVLALVDRAPEAASIIDDAYDGPFAEFVFEQTSLLPESIRADAEPSLV